MSKKKGGRGVHRKLSRQQEKLLFAIQHQRKKAQQSGGSIVRRRDPQVQRTLEFLASGKSSDPKIQAIKDKIRKGFSYNPAAGKKPKFEMLGNQKILVQRTTAEATEPEFVNTWVPSAKEKGKLAARAQSFLMRIRKKQMADLMQSDRDRMLRKVARAEDKKLLEALGGYKYYEHDEKPTLSRTVELYGKRGYHLVPRLELHSMSEKTQLDPHRVVYPAESKEAFSREASRLFPGFKKRIIAEKDLEGNKVKTFTGEYIHSQQVNRIASPSGKQFHIPFQSKSGDRLKMVKSSKGGYQLKSFTIPHTVTQDTNIHSPFRRSALGRTRNVDDEVIRARREGGAFIVEESTGQRLLSPKLLKQKRIEPRSSNPWGDWQPRNFWDRMKWDSVHTTDNERLGIWNKSVKEREINPLRADLQEAEYQTWLKYQKQKPSTTEEKRTSIVTSIRSNAQARHGARQIASNIRRINQEKRRLETKLRRIDTRAKRRDQNLTFIQRINKRVKRLIS